MQTATAGTSVQIEVETVNWTPSSQLVACEVGLDSWDNQSDSVTINNRIWVSDTQSNPPPPPKHRVCEQRCGLKSFCKTKPNTEALSYHGLVSYVLLTLREPLSLLCRLGNYRDQDLLLSVGQCQYFHIQQAITAHCFPPSSYQVRIR